MAKRTFGVGIVSTGWVAGAHAANFKQLGDCQIVAVSSRRKNRAEEFIREQQLPMAEAYGSFQSMLNNDRLDIVVLASPHTLHPSQTIAAARAGKHVVIEKPVALNERDLRAMVREVNKAGVKTSVCFELHWNGLFRNIKAMLEKRLIGQVYHGEVSYNHGVGPWYGQWSWNIKKRMAGSAELTAGCHAVDGLIWFMGCRVAEVVAISNTSRSNPLKYQYDPNSTALLRFENGATGTVHTSIECRMPYLFPILLQGDRGAIYNDKLSLVDWPATQGWAQIPAALPDSGDVDDHPYLGQFAHFADCLRRNRRPQNDLKAAAHVHEVCFAIQQAIRRKRIVKVRRTPGT